MATVSRVRLAKMTSSSSRAMPTTTPIPVENPATMMPTSEKKMLNGGNPINAAMAISQGTASPGRRTSRARTSSIRGVPSTSRMRPDSTNRVALVSPWPSTYSSTAGSAAAPMAAPTAIMPMCSMLE